ncbi:MAG: (2Fe-2S)-binding protein [Desulfurococcaceae archaeon]
MVDVTLRVNGVEYKLSVPPGERLIDTLRYRLGLMGTKEGCGRGECGTCIVLVNGEPRHSCLTLTARLDGAEVTTIEGIAPPGKLHAIQVAFIEERGVQCGFCTPGFVMITKALLDRNPNPSDEEIREWLASVLCRCGSYVQYFRAVKRAAKYLAEGKVFFDEREVKEKYHLKVIEVRAQ